MRVNEIDHTEDQVSGEPVGIEIALKFKRREFHELEREPDGRLQATVSISNDAGQSRELGPERFPLSQLKWSEPPNPGTVHFALLIPWDGKDNQGKTFRGKINVHYEAELVSFPEEALRQAASAVSGRITFIVGQ